MKRYSILPILLFVASLCVVQARPTKVEMDNTQSSVSYDLSHPLHEVHAVSKDTKSEMEVDFEKKQITKITADVDVTTFDSGNSNRDSHAMEVIDAITYPDVEFTSTSVEQKGDSVQVDGSLTFHGITKAISIKGSIQWKNSSVIVDGRFTISLTAFKIDRPSLLMIPVDDELKFTLHGVYRGL